jgi:integral membrane protein (TIGR01906 family)
LDTGSARRLRSVSTVLGILLTLCLLVGNVLLSTHGVAINIGLYEELWSRYGVPEETGMSMEELSRAGQALIAYLTGESASPQIDAVISGKSRLLFNEKEISHLEDVRRLFASGLSAEWISITAAFAATVLLTALGSRRTASIAYFAAAAISILILIILAIPASFDFTGWWTNFHLITFTNDLWLLDPDTDWLIKMFPENFFFSMVERIGLHAAITSAALAGVGLLLRRRRQGSQS